MFKYLHTWCWNITQGPCMAARAGFEPTTLRSAASIWFEIWGPWIRVKKIRFSIRCFQAISQRKNQSSGANFQKISIFSGNFKKNFDFSKKISDEFRFFRQFPPKFRFSKKIFEKF